MVGIEVQVSVIKVVAPEFKLSEDFWQGVQASATGLRATTNKYIDFCCSETP
jgi:hypothetical protein